MTIITAEVVGGALEVTGIVTGQTDPAAACVLTVTSGSTVRSAQTAVNPSGGNSFCPLLTVGVDELATGPWEVVLSYLSDAGVTGVSAPVVVEVP